VTRTRAAVLTSVLVLAATAVLLMWRPWDQVPGELRAALSQIDELPGVADVDVDYEVTVRDAKDGHAATALVTARLDEDLRPEQAAETARRAAAVVHGIEVPGVASLHRSFWVSAGVPETINDVEVFPISVAFPEPGSEGLTEAQPVGALGVEEAFALWHAGAVTVRGGAVTVRDGDHLLKLTRFAAEHGIAASLRTTDDRLAYETMGAVPDVETARLLADVGTLPGVRTVGYDAYAEPVLRVGLDVENDSAQADAVLSHVEAVDHAERLGHPVEVTLTDPEFAQRSGWVSALAPPKPEPHPLPQPAGVEPWPDDASAPDCRGADLELSYGGSDAATGARYASVRARNVGESPCAVEAVPEVVFRGADGAPQQDVTLEAYGPGVVPARVVVPAGAEIFAPLEWRAMSTAGDPDLTTAIEVTPVPRAEPVLVDVLGHVSAPSGLDLLDGATVRVGPWVQAAEGWA
jgi:hypothetical protein